MAASKIDEPLRAAIQKLQLMAELRHLGRE